MGATQSTNHPLVLETRLGKLTGIEQRDLSGKPICHRYLKVPFALPPVGSLRWRRPKPLPQEFSFDASDGSPGDYTNFGPICPQPVYAHGAAEVENPSAAPPIENIQSEDCLYLNVWVPAQPAPAQGWPIQFHIHGGWLQIGDACQSNDTDPFDLLAHSTPRIIVAPTYRLNLFGFLAGADLASCGEDPAASNYGFWDQRCALEWTAKHIHHFGGNPGNITVGGLSAGANSTFFQLYYDTHLPSSQRLIKRIYLWSNAVGIQPLSTTSEPLTAQFNSLCTAHSIPTTLPAAEKLSRLRSISSASLIASLPKLSMHTFRASTDQSFIPADFLSSIHSGAYTTRLARHDISITLGEVRDEALLYKLINPPSNHSELITQLRNYYPAPVVDALIPLYPVPPPESTNAEEWASVFAAIVADAQVHASLRGFTHSLLNPPRTPDVVAVKPSNVHRYRICFRHKGLDAWLKPEVGVCHAADTPIWWQSGWRSGFTDLDKEKVAKFLEPFGQFLTGPVSVGKQNAVDSERGNDSSSSSGAEDRVRVLDAEGIVKEDVKDELWQRGMQVWTALWEAQKHSAANL